MKNQYCLLWVDRQETYHYLDFDTPEEVQGEILNLLSISKVEQDRIRIFRRPGMSVEEFLSNKSKDIVDCPHCYNAMRYEPHTAGDLGAPSHIYTCDECPNIMFEYSDFHNVLGLVSYLGQSDTLKSYYQRSSSPASPQKDKLTTAVLKMDHTAIQSAAIGCFRSMALPVLEVINERKNIREAYEHELDLFQDLGLSVYTQLKSLNFCNENLSVTDTNIPAIIPALKAIITLMVDTVKEYNEGNANPDKESMNFDNGVFGYSVVKYLFDNEIRYIQTGRHGKTYVPTKHQAPEGDWIELMADQRLQTSLNGIVNEDETVGYIVESNGNVQDYRVLTTAIEAYVKACQWMTTQMRERALQHD